MKLIISILSFLIVIGTFSAQAQKFIQVKKDGEYRFINVDGQRVYNLLFESYTEFEGEQSVVKIKGKFGVMNHYGDLIIEPKYSNIIKNGTQYRLFDSDRVGLASLQGKIMVPLEFKWVENLKEGKAFVLDFEDNWHTYASGKLERCEGEIYFITDTPFYIDECGPEEINCTFNYINKFINSTLRYPALAMENNIEGRVVLELIIDESGFLSKARLVKGIGEGLDAEALRIMDELRLIKFNPAMKDGKPVKCKFHLPLQFHLLD